MINKRLEAHKETIDLLTEKGFSPSEIAETLKDRLDLKVDSIRRYIQEYVKPPSGSTQSDQTTNLPRVLVYDLETTPLLGYVWRLWQQNLDHKTQLITDKYSVLTWSAKWLFEPEILKGVVTPAEAKKQDDKRIIKDLWKLIDEADFVIAHNGVKFDNRQLNSRFAFHRLPPPSPYRTIDTLKAAKAAFDLPSHSLQYISKFLGFTGKIETGGMELWTKCINGDKDALQLMTEYNDKDVTLLEEIYLVLRPYIKNHPNFGLWVEDDVSCCPACTSKNLIFSGSYSTNANVYDAFRCKDCGASGRSKKGRVGKEKRKGAIASS
jgi:RNase_H superfamily